MQKNLHHFNSFNNGMLVSATVQSKSGVKHVKKIKILLQKQIGYTLADAYPEILETVVLVLRNMDNIMYESYTVTSEVFVRLKLL